MARVLPEDYDPQIAVRVKNVREVTQATAKVFAQRIGISRGFLSEIENAKAMPSQKTLDALARVYRVNQAYILRDEAPMFLGPTSQQVDNSGAIPNGVVGHQVAEPPPSYASGKHAPKSKGSQVISPAAQRSLSSVAVLEPVVLTASGTELEPVQYEVIPMFQGEMGADGRHDPRLGDIAFSLSFMARRFSGSDKLRMLVHRGDGMSPTLEHGEEIIIDTGVREVRVDGIYAVRYQGGEEVVKRIQRKLNGTLVVRSDNERYDREEIAANEAERLEIMGMMVWPRVR